MNYERWKHLRDLSFPPNCMDWRHVQMINAVLSGEKPQSVVEIGCFQGFSTSAIIEAHEACPFLSVDLVDPSIRPSVRENAPKGWNLVEIRSQDYTGKPECWLIDGDHWGGALVDYANARLANAKIIIIHDTNCINDPDYAKNFSNGGAGTIGARLRYEAEGFFEDKERRPDELTGRRLTIGFFYLPAYSTLQALRDLAK